MACGLAQGLPDLISSRGPRKAAYVAATSTAGRADVCTQSREAPAIKTVPNLEHAAGSWDALAHEGSFQTAV